MKFSDGLFGLTLTLSKGEGASCPRIRAAYQLFDRCWRPRQRLAGRIRFGCYGCLPPRVLIVGGDANNGRENIFLIRSGHVGVDFEGVMRREPGHWVICTFPAILRDLVPGGVIWPNIQGGQCCNFDRFWRPRQRPSRRIRFGMLWLPAAPCADYWRGRQQWSGKYFFDKIGSWWCWF